MVRRKKTRRGRGERRGVLEGSGINKQRQEEIAMTIYISNAFSLAMVDGEDLNINIREVNLPDVIHKIQNFVSIVGHKDTAAVFSSLLNVKIDCNRQSIKLTANDVLYVGQLTGGRLPEGTTTLPENFKIKWLVVRVSDE